MTVFKWWEDPEQAVRFQQRMAAMNIDRRDMLKVVGAAGGTGAISAFLAACGGGGDDEDTSGEETSTDGGDTGETSGGDEQPTATTAQESADSGDTGETSGEDEQDAATPESDSSESQSAEGADGELAEEQVFRVAIERDPLHFDYNLDLYAAADTAVWGMLGKFNVDNEAVPDIAESWESNEDASVWTFKIRQDTAWSNGEPVTAHDYEWSWKRLLDPETAASYAGYMYDLNNAQAFNTGEGATRDDVGVTAVDDFTLECTMQQPTAYWPLVISYPAGAPSYRPAVEEFGDTWTEPENIVCNGPFVLVEWEHDVQFALEKNEHYWNYDNITLERVERPIIPVESQMLAYENDEVDQILRGEFGQLDNINNNEQLSQDYFEFNTFGTWYLVPDPTFEPFDVPEVRHAMAHAIDRKVIADQVLQGLGRPATTMYPPGTPGYIEETFPELTAYDPEKAMSMLDGTPYEGGQNWPAITLTHREEGDGPRIAAGAMIQMLKQNLNMDIEHEVGEPETTYERMYNHDIQLMFVRWYIDYPDWNNMFYFIWYEFPSGSRHTWTNDEYDQLVSEARGGADFEERKEMYKEAQRIQLEEAAAIYVYYIWAYGLNKPWLGNMPHNSDGEPMPTWNVFQRDYEFYKMLKR